MGKKYESNFVHQHEGIDLKFILCKTIRCNENRYEVRCYQNETKPPGQRGLSNYFQYNWQTEGNNNASAT